MYEQAKPLLDGRAADLARLADVSLGVRTADSAAFLLAYLQSNPNNDGRLPEYVHDAARYLPPERVAALVDWTIGRSTADLPLAQRFAMALKRASQERLLPLPEAFRAWAVQTTSRLLASSKLERVKAGLELAQELAARELFDALADIASSSDDRVAELRPAAIDGCTASDREKSMELLSGILGDLKEPMPLRQKAAASLANLGSGAARNALVKQLRIASDRLAIEIAAALAAKADGGELLLTEIAAGKASPRLLQEPAVQQRLRAANVRDLAARLDKLTAGLPPADERIVQLLAERRKGFGAAKPDVESGKAVFQKTCAACHRLSGQGGKVGPDLDGVGLRGPNRLMEDMLDPSRNVDQAFRSTVLNTSDGRTLSGLLLRNEGAVLVLADAQGKEVRIPESDVEERAVTSLSPMPGNVADLVPEADFYHLLAYLLEQREKQ